MSEMTYEELRAAQQKEYGEWVATEPITVGGVLAFNTGDPVPRGHVDRGVVSKEQVSRRSAKTAEAPKAAVTEGTV